MIAYDADLSVLRYAPGIMKIQAAPEVINLISSVSGSGSKYNKSAWLAGQSKTTDCLMIISRGSRILWGSW